MKTGSATPFTHHPHAALPSPESFLGSAFVEAVRYVLRAELQARLPVPAAAGSPWMTPPAAARLTRVPVKTIRAWARAGRIPKRLKNTSAVPRQQKYLVNVDEVVRAATISATPSPCERTILPAGRDHVRTDADGWARERLEATRTR